MIEYPKNVKQNWMQVAVKPVVLLMAALQTPVAGNIGR